MSKEITIDHKTIGDSQNITPVMEKEFNKRGLDIHRHEVESLNDDFKTGKRHLTVKNTQYFQGIGAEAWERIFGKPSP